MLQTNMHHWQILIASTVRGWCTVLWKAKHSSCYTVSSAQRMQKLIFLVSKSPVLSSCVDSYMRTQLELSHRVILNNTHFRTNAMRTGDVWCSCSFPSDWFPVWSGPVRSGPGLNEGPFKPLPPDRYHLSTISGYGWRYTVWSRPQLS